MRTNLAKFPAPYFGGKSAAAAHVWHALGDVAHYVEPFAGSAAVLLLRPHEANRPYHSETINDRDCLIVNALRALAYHPEATAAAAAWYVTEADIMARQLAILEWIAAGNPERIMGQVHFCDPEIAGWWLYGMSCWIGAGFASGDGPWVLGADGRISKRASADHPGAHRKLPHLADNGQGSNRMTLRAPGVARQRPHLANDGQGSNHAGTRAPGVGSGGTLAGDDPAEVLSIPADLAFHAMVMPELTRWFAFLSARLRHVRIVNGDWHRVATTGALKTLSIRTAKTDTETCGVFFDPPYGHAASRDMRLYTHDSGDIAADVRAWCMRHGEQPWLRIVLAGFAGEGHEVLERHGWRVVEWFTPGFIKGGFAQQSDAGTQQHKERLWMSPHCIAPATLADLPMFAELGTL